MYITISLYKSEKNLQYGRIEEKKYGGPWRKDGGVNNICKSKPGSQTDARSKEKMLSLANTLPSIINLMV